MLDRMISTELVEEDITIENNLRPQNLDDYIGQEKGKAESENFHRGGKEQRRVPGPCSSLRTAGTWKDYAGWHRRQ